MNWTVTPEHWNEALQFTVVISFLKKITSCLGVLLKSVLSRVHSGGNFINLPGTRRTREEENPCICFHFLVACLRKSYVTQFKQYGLCFCPTVSGSSCDPCYKFHYTLGLSHGRNSVSTSWILIGIQGKTYVILFRSNMFLASLLWKPLYNSLCVNTHSLSKLLARLCAGFTFFKTSILPTLRKSPYTDLQCWFVGRYVVKVRPKRFQVVSRLSSKFVKGKGEPVRDFLYTCTSPYQRCVVSLYNSSGCLNVTLRYIKYMLRFKKLCGFLCANVTLAVDNRYLCSYLMIEIIYLPCIVPHGVLSLC